MPIEKTIRSGDDTLSSAACIARRSTGATNFCTLGKPLASTSSPASTSSSPGPGSTSSATPTTSRSPPPHRTPPAWRSRASACGGGSPYSQVTRWSRSRRAARDAVRRSGVRARPPARGAGATMTPCATSSTSPTWSGTPRWCGSGRSPPGIAATGAGQGRVLQPRRQREGPHRAAHGRGRGGVGRAAARRHDRRADLRQHRRRAGDRRPAQGLPVRVRLPGQGGRGQAQRAARRTAPRSWSARPRSTRTTPTPTTAPRTGWSSEIDGAWKPNQYANPENPRVALPAAPGPELWEQTDGRITHFVAGIGTGGTISGTGPLPQGGVRRAGAGDRRRPGGLGVLRRHRPALPRRGRGRGLLAHHLRQGHLRPDRRGLRRRLVRDDAAARARGGAAGRRVVRDGDGGGAAGGGRARARRGPRRRGRRAAARRRPRLPRQGVQRRVDGRLRVPAARAGRHGRRRAAPQGRRDPGARARPPERDRRRRRALPARVRTSPRCRWCVPSRR